MLDVHGKNFAERKFDILNLIPKHKSFLREWDFHTLNYFILG